MTGTTRRRLLAGLAAALAVPAAARRRQRLAPIPLDRLSVLASGLDLPEGVAADRLGRVYASSHGPACTVIGPDGGMKPVGPAIAGNGIALDGRGHAAIATFGLLRGTPGPLLRLDLASGALSTWCGEIEGRTLVASNQPAVARDRKVYCTHSAWSDPANIGRSHGDGFVYRVAPDGKAEIVAAGIRGANGCCFDGAEAFLYVAETGSGRILRFRRRGEDFGPAEAFGPVLGRVAPDERVAAIRARIAGGDRDHGYPDGIAFDAAGNLWVTLPFANRIVAITPEGRVETMIDDPRATILDMPTNIAWGGPGLRRLVVASRANGRILAAPSPVAGLPLVHQRA